MIQGRQIRVLLVDDDEDDYLMLRDLLSEIQGVKFTLDWASSYEAGKASLSEQSYDVCFMDYRLGGRTGLDLLKETIASGCRIPIILLTGYGEREVDLEAMRVGAADYLVKDQVSALLLERSIRYSLHRAQGIETLREREESFRSLLDAIFEGILVHDHQGTILDVNQAAVRIFGYPREEMIGSHLSRLCSEDCQQVVAQVAVSCEETLIEATGVRKDGTSVALEISGKPYQHRGRSSRLTTVRDITARKEMEAKILMQDRLASVGLLASSLAHEIGTPLGVIRGRAEYLGLQSPENPSVKKNVDVIVSQIDRVSKLIRSLLNLARGDQMKQADHVLLDQIVSEVIDLMGHELKRQGVEVRNEISQELPIAVAAEAAPLQQVLLNLLINSVHAIGAAVKEQGRPAGHFVRIGARDAGSRWVLSVQDSGCGISRKNLRNLFKPFFTTKEIGVGTGLGLATSYRIVESWGGAIEVESQEGVGTEFRILLPKSRAEASNPPLR